jgi:predicted MFS family arabinose efflux permease
MPETTPPARPSLQFVLIFFAHALGAMSVLAVLTAGPQLAQELGLSPLQLGGLASIYSAALAAASLPAGMVTDSLGTRAALTGAATIISAGLTLAATAQGFVHLGMGMALCGAGYGLINPAAGRAIALWFAPKWRTTLLSLKQTGVPVGAALGSGTALLGPIWGWQAGIVAAAILALGAAIAFALLLPQERRTRPERHPPTGKLTAILTLPGLSRAALAAGVTNGLQFALWAHLADILFRAHTASTTTVGLCFGALHLGTFLGRVAWGALTDHWLRGNAARALWLLCALGLLGTACLGALPFTGGAALAIAASFVLGLSVCAAVGVHTALIVNIAPQPLIGGALGYTMLVTNFGGVLVPMLLGLALAYGSIYGVVFTIAALISVAMVLVNSKLA